MPPRDMERDELNHGGGSGSDGAAPLLSAAGARRPTPAPTDAHAIQAASAGLADSGGDGGGGTGFGGGSMLPKQTNIADVGMPTSGVLEVKAPGNDPVSPSSAAAMDDLMADLFSEAEPEQERPERLDPNTTSDRPLWPMPGSTAAFLPRRKRSWRRWEPHTGAPT